MSLFEFVLVMTSLVLGIGIAHLLRAVATLIRHRASLEIDWVPLVWTATIFGLVTSYWWSLWDFRDVEWTFAGFIYITVSPAVLYVAMTLLLPENIDQRREPLGSLFEEIRVPFLILMTVFVVLVILDGWFLAGEALWNSLRFVQGGVLANILIAASTSSRRVQKATSVLVLLLLLYGLLVLRLLPGAFGSSA
jgi:hypothetical protein